MCVVEKHMENKSLVFQISSRKDRLSTLVYTLVTRADEQGLAGRTLL